MSPEIIETAIRRARNAGIELRPQSSPQGVAELAEAMRVKLPDDFVAFYTGYDGAQNPGVADNEDLLSLAEIWENWELLRGVWSELDQDSANREADPQVEPVMWSPAWVPFTHDGGGNYLCLDLAPNTAGGGQIGQVIRYWNSEPPRTRVAASFSDWLRSVAWTP
jgi:cell wall assembly regulator SMI1